MERSDLETSLADRCSLDEIGRRTGRHPSTVSYWLEKHGLEPLGRDLHAPRGGLDRDTLRALIESELTVAEIAISVERSATTVRYWLRFHGLETRRSARLRAGGVPERRHRGRCAATARRMA